jgi:hypothetical protein
VKRSSGASVDIGKLLGLSGPGAWVLAGLYCVTYVTLAVLSGGEPLQTWEGRIALVLVLATAVLLVLPWRYPLPFPLVAWVLAVVVFSTAAICWHLSPEGWPGWTSWNFGADTFLLFMLALRGRVWWGSVGIALMMAVAILWTLTTTGDWFHGFDLTYRQGASYFAGAFFAFWLKRTADQIAEFQSAEQRVIAAEQAQNVAAEERHRQLERVRSLAGPALELIAHGSPSAEDRRHHALLEAELRDEIRGRALTIDGLPAAVRSARGRGVDVALLDDLRDEAPTAEFLKPAVAWAVEQVASLQGGDATIRLAQVDGKPVVTFATSHGSAQTFSPE